MLRGSSIDFSPICFVISHYIRDHSCQNDQGLHLLVEMRVSASDIAEIAFEVLYVDWVEADDGCVETHISLCQAVTKVEWPAGFGEVCFCAV